MTEYRLVITATGEVRDKDGNLISTEPLQTEMVLTEDQILASLGDEK